MTVIGNGDDVLRVVHAIEARLAHVELVKAPHQLRLKGYGYEDEHGRIWSISMAHSHSPCNICGEDTKHSEHLWTKDGDRWLLAHRACLPLTAEQYVRDALDYEAATGYETQHVWESAFEVYAVSPEKAGRFADMVRKSEEYQRAFEAGDWARIHELDKQEQERRGKEQ
jgi:hypothetical protein